MALVNLQLVTKDPNYSSSMQCHIKVASLRSNAITQTIYPFEDNRWSKANDHIQEQKLAFTKNTKGVMDHSLIL